MHVCMSVRTMAPAHAHEVVNWASYVAVAVERGDRGGGSARNFGHVVHQRPRALTERGNEEEDEEEEYVCVVCRMSCVAFV